MGIGYNRAMTELLNIINDQDEVIGEKSRSEIHKTGLLHREIHVYFVTPQKEIILQHRAKDKDTFPDLLDATVGGHVEIGQSYEETALKETAEETGLVIKASDLIPIDKIKVYSADQVTGKINYAIRALYLYIYRGDIADLKVETGKALGFEAWPLANLTTLEEKDKAKFIPGFLDFLVNNLTKFIQTIKL